MYRPQPPYARCPGCGAETLGVLTVMENRYERRCSGCQHGETRTLPTLSKRVIYLDQMIVSEMTKALIPDLRPARDTRLDEFWSRAFFKMSRLVRLQLACCPFSEFHGSESLLSPFNRLLRNTCKCLSSGVSVRPYPETLDGQLVDQLRAWLGGGGTDGRQMERGSAFRGRVDAWQDHISIELVRNVTSTEVDDVRALRDAKSAELEPVVERWKGESVRFGARVREELSGYGRRLLRFHQEFLSRFADLGRLDGPSPLDLLPLPSHEVTMLALVQAAVEFGLSRSDARARVVEFLQSEGLERVSLLRGQAMLWAAISLRVKAGKSAIEPSLFGDINMLSLMLPLCDAIFIDRACHALLEENPLKDELPHGAHLFSRRNPEEFLAYLDAIEASASPAHLAAVREVYGNTAFRDPTA